MQQNIVTWDGLTRRTVPVGSERLDAFGRDHTRFDGPLTVAEAMGRADLAWDVELAPLFTEQTKTTEDGSDTYTIRRQLTSHRAVRREDTKAVLGVVGNRWTPLHNREAFAALEPLVDHGLAQIRAAGHVKGGAIVALQVRFNLPADVQEKLDGGTGPVEPFGFVSTRHDGKGSVTIGETPIVMVCQNTLMANRAWIADHYREHRDMGRAIVVPHLKNVGVEVIAGAERIWTDLVRRYESIAAQYAALRVRALDEAMFKQLVLNVAAPPPAPGRTVAAGAKTNARTEQAMKDATTKRDRLTALWQGAGAGITGNGSAWEAYMAVTESIDHDVQVWTVRKADRGFSAVAGDLAAVKGRVLASLLTEAR